MLQALIIVQTIIPIIYMVEHSEQVLIIVQITIPGLLALYNYCPDMYLMYLIMQGLVNNNVYTKKQLYCQTTGRKMCTVVSEVLATVNENQSQITCYAVNGDWLFIT